MINFLRKIYKSFILLIRFLINRFRDSLFELDKITIICIFFLLFLSFLMSFSLGSVVTYRINVSQLSFILKHFLFLLFSVILILWIGNIRIEKITRYSNVAFFVLISLLFLVLFIGTDIKGSKRWLYFIGFSLQPSEILKPFFVILNAKILSKIHENDRTSLLKSMFLTLSCCLLLILEPDFGMTLIYLLTSFFQMFIAGVSVYFMRNLIITGCLGFAGIFVAFSHVRYRIFNFFTGLIDGNMNYQTKKSIQAVHNGGLFGKGYGNGSIKYQLPDAHTDYIFAVIFEEFGYLFAIFLVILYYFIIIRNLILILRISNDKFNILILYGLMFMFMIQVIINIGVSINILPSKGMTLPFISHGGSSILGMSILFGVILSITKLKNDIDYNNRKILSVL